MDPEVPAILTGKPAPDFSFVDVGSAHETHSLDAFRGRVVIVDFWGAYCEPCKIEFPELEALYRRYAANGLEIVAISQDEPEDRAKIPGFVDTYGATFHIGWDERHAIHALYTPGSMPSSYVVDRRGVVRFEHIGHHDGDAAELEREVQALLSEQGR
jgi:peroxiredoxin